jgi:DNA-binding NtrC family response regulator
VTPVESPADRASVLLIDDDESVRRLLSDFLAPLGYDVREAADATTGLRLVVAAPPDAILLDIDMPGLSGVEALPSLRALTPTSIILIVSGSTDPTVASLARGYGAFDFVTKPIDFARLGKSLETAMAIRRVQP